MAVVNGHASTRKSRTDIEIDILNRQLRQSQNYVHFHGDPLLADKVLVWSTTLQDLRKVFTWKNMPDIATVIKKLIQGKGLDVVSGAKLVGALPDNSKMRAGFTETNVQAKYDKMLHPPLSYLGDAFQYRTVDGRFNSAIHPHLGQANSPYAKTVPSKTHALGALPDPGDLFDRLMAREKDGRVSESGLSSMLIYHATIIIHDIFRTNPDDKNISDSSSYLDLSPLYGYTPEMQRSIRDDKYKLGLLKPDTFAEDRLLRQPAGVCIMLVMYNRYHNYAATQLRRINENGRFSVPSQYLGPKLVALAKRLSPIEKQDQAFQTMIQEFTTQFETYQSNGEKRVADYEKLLKAAEDKRLAATDDKSKRALDEELTALNVRKTQAEAYEKSETAVETFLKTIEILTPAARAKFEKDYDEAWNKQDEDLFQTARLITCGMYIQISIHDYLRALMGFHQFKTDFTLDPRIAMTEHRNVSRGLGNQVTIEFNLLYRFHCAISLKDEQYTETYLREYFGKLNDTKWEPKNMQLPEFLYNMRLAGIRDGAVKEEDRPKAYEQTFGLKSKADLNFSRHPVTGLFDDQKMVDELMRAMNDPISNFGPRNVPRCMRAIEVMGIMQARKWEVGSLNDFREFFGMSRHKTFESITGDFEVQTALRDLYDHPDQVELYPGIFCESDANRNADPGPSGLDSALWSAIFSDAITLVRSDRFYTVDWNTKNLTSWGMAEVTPDDSAVNKSSVFHRLIQRAFPEWFPYDSINFFHPFYTSQTNAKYAQEQGFGNDFRFDAVPNPPKNEPAFDTERSLPQKPWKPVYLSTYEEITALMSDDTDNFVHPSRFELDNLPAKVKEILEPGSGHASKHLPSDSEFEEVSDDLAKYFTNLGLDMIKRESILMDSDKGVYQIDATRDFAIPCITRSIADFLGFGHLVKSDTNPSAPYSENEIYEHITNCQIFLAYNADETKLLKRRAAFRASMNFLYELTTKANILKANGDRWMVVRWARKLFGRHETNAMIELGYKIAKQILSHDSDVGRAAAILLLVGLDSAYNSVLSFTSVLNNLVLRPYDIARNKTVPLVENLLKVQTLAYSGKKEDLIELQAIILDAQRKCVRLPVIRKAIAEGTIGEGVLSKPIKVRAGQTIICDISKVAVPAKPSADEYKYLSYASSFTSRFSHYHPKHVAVLGLVSMIKVLAQMKNLRPGNDTQGRLKKINIDASYEGYGNFMAPGRMRRIAAQVKEMVDRAPKDTKQDAQEEASRVFTKDLLKPKTDTYMTPEWDEFVPFPTTWKVRFNGFGLSDKDYPSTHMPLDTSTFEAAPFYQPRGPSNTGGSFALPVCVCAAAGSNCKCSGSQAAAASTETETKATEKKDSESLDSSWAHIEVMSTHAGPITAAEGIPLQYTGSNGCGVPVQTFRAPQ